MTRFVSLCLCATCALLAALPAGAQTAAIRLNQLGFYPEMPKVAVVIGATQDAFYVTTADGADTVVVGTLAMPYTWTFSNETGRKADFTALTTPGRYNVVVPGIGASYPFEVRARAFQPLAAASIKAFYYQRASTALSPTHAGRWARSAGHPDTQVRVHASAATAQRPEGTLISAPKGWYDAGDFNKYVVNSGISTATLLQLYEHFPAYFNAFALNIPESGNALPDLLDEVLWNLRWMLAMQDPGDGGVYHKLTTANFEGMVMPSQARQQRYVVQKSTAAALNFAAVMAQASRIFRAFPDALPGLADSTLDAAHAAWRWARRHPAVYYQQNTLNQQFSPAITTGEYGDGNVSDEFIWAATELYVTTKADSFLTPHNPFSVQRLDVPAWPNVTALGFYSLLHHADSLTAAANMLAIERELIERADALTNTYRTSPMGVGMGGSVGDFSWGSNSVAANQGMLLLQAYRLSEDPAYLHAALAGLDYILGRNGVGISFVTGYGARTPLNPHHRQSAADGVRDPVPGLLAGGPNPARQDAGGCPAYPSTLPAKAYIDHECSYASNEIAINWNAPLAYLAGALEALLAPGGVPVSVDEAAPGKTGYHAAPTLRVSPNPARDAATVSFTLDAPARVTLSLYDLLGREVARLADARPTTDGAHTYTLRRDGLGSGVYACHLRSSGGLRETALVVFN